MIATLAGVLKAAEGTCAVVDCHGVGYAVDMPAPSLMSVGPPGSAVDLFIYTHVAEDQLRLFGFLSKLERDTFAVALACAGVGPRLALTMLSALTPAALQEAVAQKDKRALMQVPGIGGKKAERLLVDLEGKFNACPAPVLAGAARPAAASAGLAEVEGALLHLGFAAPDASEAAQAAREQAGEAADVAALVRHALRALSRRSAGTRRSVS